MKKLLSLLLVLSIALMLVGVMVSCAKEGAMAEQESEAPEGTATADEGMSMEDMPEDTVPIEPEISSMDAMTAACVETFHGTPLDMQSSFQALFGHVTQNQMEIAGPPFSVYYFEEQEWNPNDIRFDSCVPVSAPFEEQEVLKYKEFPASPAAIYIYEGSYEKMGDIYWGLGLWLEENELELQKLSFEVYLVGPGGEQPVDPEDYITKIIMPLKQE